MAKYMTAGDLRCFLKQFKDADEVWLSSDEEGNSFGRIGLDPLTMYQEPGKCILMPIEAVDPEEAVGK